MKYALLLLAACSVEKLPPIVMVHRGLGAPAHRVVVLPVECEPAENVSAGTDSTAWCAGVEAAVASELSFDGIEVVDLKQLPARERTRELVNVTTNTADHEKLTVTGAMAADVDMWSQRELLAQLQIDGVVHISAARTETWPARAVALVQITRASDASLIVGSVCELEVSRIDTEAEMIDRAARCAIGGLK